MILRSDPGDQSVRRSLRHKTIAAAVADELRRQVVDGYFKGGQQLRQDALAAEFGVSRIPIREALMQLEAEGLVTISPHRGATVTEISSDDVEELFDLRILLEPRLLRASGPQLSAEDYASLNLLLKNYSSELRAEHAGRWGEMNTEFHLLLYRRAQQPRSLTIVANLLQESDRLTRMQLSFTEDSKRRAEEEHAELLRLCAVGQIREACALLKNHIENVRKPIRKYALRTHV